MAPLACAADPDGFSDAAADAVGGARREAFGVRQLAAAFLMREQRVCPHAASSAKPFRVLRVFRGLNQSNHRLLIPKSAPLHDTTPTYPQISPPDKTKTPKVSFRCNFRLRTARKQTRI
ncbi:MAG: hypothetical protein GX456_00660 [Verrucomicrobia bacterium]|nr:hypothetical protein [Verrucomicrobiota bacterium]